MNIDIFKCNDGITHNRMYDIFNVRGLLCVQYVLYEV